MRLMLEMLQALNSVPEPMAKDYEEKNICTTRIKGARLRMVTSESALEGNVGVAKGLRKSKTDNRNTLSKARNEHFDAICGR